MHLQTQKDGSNENTALCNQMVQNSDDVQMLALGKTHGTNEFLKFKVDCIKKLVSERHYSIVAIEADFVGTSWPLYDAWLTA